MSKIKIVNADFDKETGISTVTINTPYGYFTGISKLHPDDQQYASNFAGCEYAEMRAKIKYMKAILRDKKSQLKAIKSVIKFSTAFSLSSEIKRRENEIEEIKKNIASAEKFIKEKITLRDETHKKFAEWAKITK